MARHLCRFKEAALVDVGRLAGFNFDFGGFPSAGDRIRVARTTIGSLLEVVAKERMRRGPLYARAEERKW